MSVDISAAKAKARAARFVSSWDADPGLAGVEKTRKEPPFFSDKSSRLLREFASLVPLEQRDNYISNVMSRLSGATGFDAVRASCLQAAKGVIGVEMLRAHDLSPKVSIYEARRGSRSGTPKLGVVEEPGNGADE